MPNTQRNKKQKNNQTNDSKYHDIDDIQQTLYSKDDVDRLCVSGKEGGRRHTSFEDYVGLPIQ